METIKKLRMNSTSIKDQSWKAYQRTIEQMALSLTGEEYVNNSFLDDRVAVSVYLDTLTAAKKRMALSVILILISPIKYDPIKTKEDNYIHYQKLLRQHGIESDTTVSKQEKSINQTENWVEWKSIIKIQKTKYQNWLKHKFHNLKTLNKDEMLFLQDIFILSLYTLIPPRRLDYANMLMISRKSYNSLNGDTKEHNNYLVIVGRNRKFFSFGKQAQKNKNVDRNGIKQSVYVLDIPKQLNKILNIFIKFHTNPITDVVLTSNLLLNTRGNAMSINGLSKCIMRIMKDAFPDKRITATMLRTIYITSLLKNDTNLTIKQSNAEKMGNTVGVQEKYYSKK